MTLLWLGGLVFLGMIVLLLVLRHRTESEPPQRKPAPPGKNRAPIPAAVRLTASGRTDTGVKRATNEDTFILNLRRRVFGVFDGMGGMAAGETASTTASEALDEAGDPDAGKAAVTGTLRDWVLGAINNANFRVWSKAQNEPGLKGMGTTAVIAAVDQSGQTEIVAAGDSRAYLVRRGTIRQLTQDDDLASVLLRAGTITPEQHAKHPFRHHLARFLGNQDRLTAQQISLDLEPGDILLLCTDGLIRVLGDEQILEILLNTASAEEAVSELIDKTIGGGAPDNVTVIVVKAD